MARKEQVDDQVDLDEEKHWEMWQQGYDDLDFAQRHARERLSSNLDRTKGWLKAYYFGTRFVHYEAYMLCGVGRTWPNFCYHPTEKVMS